MLDLLARHEARVISRACRSLLALCLVGTLAPLALFDCASSNSGSGNPDGGVCPVAALTSGTACIASEGTTCTYQGPATPGCYCCNGGGSPGYVCSKGTWQELAYASGGGAPNNFQACPAVMPKQGDGCTPSCDGAQQSCTYDCATGNGRAGSATCANGSWKVSLLGLACRVEAGVEDAGDASDAAAD